MCKFVDETQRVVRDLVVDRFHPLLRQRPRVLDLLSAPAVRPGMQHAPRAKELLELRILGIVRVLRFLFGVQMIQVAEKFVEPVQGRQKLVPVSEMILAELTRHVTQRLQQFRDGRVFRRQADFGTRQTNLRQARADRILPGHERGSARRAALLAVVIGEGDALVGHAIDVRRAVAHLPPVVETDVPPADVVTPKDQDVRFFGCHDTSLRLVIL